MTRYVITRVLMIIPVLLGVSLMVFLMMHLIPGDIVDMIVGNEANVSVEYMNHLRSLYGLDRPLYVQYADWLGRVLKGDLGVSIRTGRSIAEELVRRFPVTLQLTVLATIISLVIGIPLGVASSVKQRSALDIGVRVTGLLGLSVPNFWIATLLILMCSLYFPKMSPTAFVMASESFLRNLRSLILPAISLGAMNSAIVMRMTRSCMLEVLKQDYIRTAYGKGLDTNRIVFKHALRNALIPVISVVGVQVGYLLGGTVVIEQIFCIPGIGTYLLGGIYQRDYTVVQGGILLTAAAFVLTNLLVDLIYAYADPKVRLN